MGTWKTLPYSGKMTFQDTKLYFGNLYLGLGAGTVRWHQWYWYCIDFVMWSWIYFSYEQKKEWYQWSELLSGLFDSWEEICEPTLEQP